MTTQVEAELIRQGTLNHIESLRVADGPYGRYRYGTQCKQTYLASAFAALTRHLFGDLDTLTDEERSEWADYLAGGQDMATGLFIDPIFRSEERDSAHHSDELLHWHNSTFILTAIELLDDVSRFPISAVHSLRSPDAMQRRLESLPWHINPWVVGNWSYDIGSLLGFDYLITGEVANLEAMEIYFEWYESHQLAETGWWDLSGRGAVEHQQYGGYHTLMVYWMYDREVPNPDAMIRSSLSIQSENGLIGEGGCCQDMDVFDAAVTLSRQYEVLRDEVAAACERYLPHIYESWHLEGGFMERNGDSYGNRVELGWKQARSGKNEADPCSDVFRGLTYALMGEALDDAAIRGLPWRHHNTFGHCVRPTCLSMD